MESTFCTFAVKSSAVQSSKPATSSDAAAHSAAGNYYHVLLPKF